jgi:2-phospho-L-lactate guanylyltransferase
MPLKATSRGKSRLGLPDDQRVALAAAMARDTVTAVRASPAVESVLVIAEDSADAALVASEDVDVMLTPVRGLNEAIADGARVLAGRGWSGPVAVLPADLPFLTPGDLEWALRAAAGHASVVADAAGIGTTLLVAADPLSLRPQFGLDSYRLHRLAGAAALAVGAGSTLHMDVDVIADLHLPAELTLLGEHTRAVVGSLAGQGFPQVTVLP